MLFFHSNRKCEIARLFALRVHPPLIAGQSVRQIKFSVGIWGGASNLSLFSFIISDDNKFCVKFFLAGILTSVLYTPIIKATGGKR